MRMNYELVAHGNSHDTEVEEREVSEVPLRGQTVLESTARI